MKLRSYVFILCMFMALGVFHTVYAAPPVVVSTIPAQNVTNVDRDTSITIKFSESVLWGTVFVSPKYYIYVQENASGAAFNALEYTPIANSDTYVLALTSSLKANTTYKVTVSSLVRSESTEEAMLAPYEFIFTTTSAADTENPSVVKTYPANTATEIPLDTKIQVNFSEPMLPESIVSSTIFLSNLTSGSVVSADVVYDGTTNTAILTPLSPLLKSNSYRIVVKKEVSDLAGKNMEADFSADFTTLLADTTPPKILSTLPVKGATSVSTDKVVIVFNEPMDKTSITTSTITVKQGATSVSGTVTYDESSNTAIFAPAAGFAFATDYTVTVSTGVRDVALNNLAAAYPFTFTTMQSTTPPDVSNYALVPPFVVGSTVKPNVLLIVDNSGSMVSPAYTGAYTPGKTYYGYFNSKKMYDYNSTNKYFTANTNSVDTSLVTSGNFLNWLATRRVDAVRMVLTGGVKDNANDREYYAANTSDAFNKTYGTTYTVTTDSNKAVAYYCTAWDKWGNCKTSVKQQLTVHISDEERDANKGLIRMFSEKMNIGIMNFNGGYDFEAKGDKDGGFVQINVGQTGADLVTQVLNTAPTTYTPLAESLYEAVRYFAASTSAYNGGNYPSGKPIESSCQRNFVVLLTDGESTVDMNIPGGKWTGYKGQSVISGTAFTAGDTVFNVKDYLDGNNSVTLNGKSTSIKGIKTVENWSSSRWDQFLNPCQYYSYYKTYGGNCGTWYLPGVAYYAHKVDLRSDLKNVQNLTIYTVFAFDDSANAKELLKLTAKYGAFDDTDGGGAPDATGKWDKNADGVPDTYFEASSGDELYKQMTTAFNDILARVSSGTAASILNNSEGSGANLLQAVFYPKKTFDAGTEVAWIGEVQNLWYYLDPYLLNSTIRVDTVEDKKLDLKKDQIARFEFVDQKTVVKLASDTNGDGVPDADSSGNVNWSSYSPDDATNVKSLWRAGRLLWERNLHDTSSTTYSPRTIYTQTNGLVDASGKPFDDSTSKLAKFSYRVESGYTSKLTAEPFFQQYLQAANTTEADKVVKYTLGEPEFDASGIMTDVVGYRSRLVTIGSKSGIWRLGDVVSSTPKLLANIALNTYAATAPTGYGDTSYGLFTTSSVYQNRGMVFVGANDGMLHAFKLGTLKMLKEGSYRAQLTGDNLGQEKWAFIPRNILPYLRYLADPQYPHLFSVDGSTLLVDVSINRPSDNDTYKNSDGSLRFKNCSSDQYWKCIKKTAYSDTTSKTLDYDKTSWRTVLIGSTGLGGASRNIYQSGTKTAGTCYDKAGANCVKTPVDGLGYSTYYALDVTDPENPKFMWEFNGDPTDGTDADKKGGNLGYATSGPLVVRVGDPDRNGRWFAVFASGPTGPITSTQFMGRSDQPLKLFVVDIGTGKLVTTIYKDTANDEISNAFAGSLSNGAIDTDKSRTTGKGFYSDDAFYVGYTQKTDASTWYSGGVVRVLTKESVYPDASSVVDASDPDNSKQVANNWTLSKLIDGIGPVTSAVTKLQDRGNKNLWLYLGSGRYFYKNDTTIDDSASLRYLYGVLDPCYTKDTNDMNQSCVASSVTPSTLQDQTTVGTYTSTTGWKIQLDPANESSSLGAERVITDPVASPSGVVFYTTFQPNSDVCAYGGSSSIWAINYSTGGAPTPRAMQGKLLMQVSTGAFAEVSMADAFTAKDGRRTGTSFEGVPPKAQGLSVLNNPRPLKKIMHVQER